MQARGALLLLWRSCPPPRLAALGHLTGNSACLTPIEKWEEGMIGVAASKGVIAL